MKKICKLAILLSIILTFNACKKDTALQEVKNTDPTEQKILNFKAQMQNPNKSNESMSIDSAVWYIEAALNYTYCDTSRNVVEIDSFFVNVTVDENGEINFNEIITAYNQLNTDLINTLYDNTLLLADIEFVNNNDKNDEQTLKMTIVRTKGFASFWTFGPDDNWQLAELNGKCDNSSSGNDASTMLTKKANYTISRPAGNAYLTDIETPLFFHGPYIIGHAWVCCEYNWLNDWLNDGKEYALTHKPTNKDIISYDFFNDILVGTKSNEYGLFLKSVSYGIWHVSNPGGGEQ